ncbi:unnamed protein product [Schistosoma curassoni]|uniref:Secreted protein n=1 Tax=Schistosoma curassoni TaxID=6186 RepID=A0A183JMU3_9TREM|nr:unnamed protein product [Schistosoma curassoni]
MIHFIFFSLRFNCYRDDDDDDDDDEDEEEDKENGMPRVIHTSYSRNFPLHTSRLSSVPPSAVGTYRSTLTSTDYGLPPVVHRNYRTNRYIYETPYYTSTYVSSSYFVRS